MTFKFTYQAVGESCKMSVSNFSGYFPHWLTQMMAQAAEPLSWAKINSLTVGVNENGTFYAGHCVQPKSQHGWAIKSKTRRNQWWTFPHSFSLKKTQNILLLLFPVIWPCWLLRLSCHQKDVRCTSVAFPSSTMRPCITPSLFHLVSLHTFLLTQLLPHPACQRQPSVIYLRLQAISSTSMTAYVDMHWCSIVSPCVDPCSTLVLSINLLRPRQSFEKEIKECVLTKIEQTLKTIVKVSGLTVLVF